MRRVSMGLHVTGCICYQPFQAMRHAVRHCGRFGHLSRCSIAAPDCAAMPHHRSGRIQAVARAALQARDVYARYRPASPSGDRPLRGNRTGGTDRAGSGCASNAGLGRADRTRRRQDGGRAASRQPLCWQTSLPCGTRKERGANAPISPDGANRPGAVVTPLPIRSLPAKSVGVPNLRLT